MGFQGAAFVDFSANEAPDPKNVVARMEQLVGERVYCIRDRESVFSAMLATTGESAECSCGSTPEQFVVLVSTPPAFMEWAMIEALCGLGGTTSKRVAKPAPKVTPPPIEEIEVLVAHPYADIWVPLAEWIRIGPGPRPFVHPVAARHARAGADLPMEVIPVRYRNDQETRELIERGVIENPWKSQDPYH